MPWKRYFVAAVGCLLMFSETSSAQQGTDQCMCTPASTLDVVKKRGVLIAGVKNDLPPLGYIDRDGKWVGVEVEMAQYLASKLGVTLKMELVSSLTRIPMLVNGNVDLLVSISPTRERAKTIDFTRAYFDDGGSAVLVYRDSGIRGAEDLAAPRKSATAQGSANATELLAMQPKAQLVYFQAYPEAFQALRAHQVDAMVAGYGMLERLAKDNPSMTVLPPLTPDPSNMAVWKNDSNWRLFLEQSIMDAWSDGTIPKLQAKYGGAPITVERWPDYFRK